MREIFRGFRQSFTQGLKEGFFHGMAKNQRTPAEKSKTQQVERMVIAEASNLLEDKEELMITQKEGGNLTIKTKKKLEEEKAFRGADFLISSSSKTNAYLCLEFYAFYRNGVSRYLVRSRIMPRSNDKPDITEREANAQDLTGLLEKIRGSRSLKK